jgi:hypothetical protein
MPRSFEACTIRTETSRFCRASTTGFSRIRVGSSRTSRKPPAWRAAFAI